MVLPYITVSIIASLGSLKPSELRTLGLRAAAVIGGLWIVALTFAFLIPLTFPSIQSASFFSSSLVERRAAFDFVALYVPANPFHALANNVVPAVVLFSIMLGVALVGVEQRERLLDVLYVTRDAIARATRYVTRLTPYGLFAIAANAAGTLDLQQLGRLQIYLVAYVIGGRAGEPLGVARAGRGAHADSRARHAPRIAGLAAHRLHRRRSVHRPAGTHAGRPNAARAARPRQGGTGPPHRGDHPGVVQLPAHRQAAVAQLRAVRRMVRRRRWCRSPSIRSWHWRAWSAFSAA